MDKFLRSFSTFTSFTVGLLFLFSCLTFTSTVFICDGSPEDLIFFNLMWSKFLCPKPLPSFDLDTVASHALDQNGNITIKWDLINWTPDGYFAIVTIYNFQQYRRIRAPGWTLGWTWARNEFIWHTFGGKATKQGDCSTSTFKEDIPQSCEKNPRIIDLSPVAPNNQKAPDCCKAGVINSNSASSFQISVGNGGYSNKTVRLPKNLIFKAPGDGYTCEPAKVVKPTIFLSPDKMRMTQAFMTWNVICRHIISGNLDESEK